MTKLTRFFGVCLLVVSLSAVASATGEGGVTQAPPAPVPPPTECVNEGSAALDLIQQTQDSSTDFGSAAETLANLLIASIL